jgi:hypothetical protein
VQLPAALQVTAEIRVLDVGARLERVFRLTRAIGEAGVRLHRDLPWEPGRPVRVALSLPTAAPSTVSASVPPGAPGPSTAAAADDSPLVFIGKVVGIAPDDERVEGERAVPRAIAFTGIEEDARQRLAAYVDERTQIP